MHGIYRHYLKLILEYLEYFPCVALIGPRQSGKSTLLDMLGKDWKKWDLEKGEDFDYINNNPDIFLQMYPDKTAIDEAQILPKLFSALRVAIDNERNKCGRYIITGPSSPELMQNISESLAGRVGIIEISPLLLSEIIQNDNNQFFKAFTDSDKFLKYGLKLKPFADISYIHKYWFRGGFPEPWVKNDERFYDLWNEQFIRTYIEKDISRLFPGLNKQRFRQFVQMLSGLSGSILNYSDIARSLGVSQTTIKDYFRITHGTFIWRQIYPYERNVTKRIVKHPKGHIRDSGILNYYLRIKDIEHLLTHPNMGNIWESMVIEEILRGLNSRGIAYDYYYYRTSAGAEIDLVLEGKFGLIPIEIKYSKTVKPYLLRAIKDFISEHNCKFGIVINNADKVLFYEENLIGVPFSHCL